MPSNSRPTLPPPTENFAEAILNSSDDAIVVLDLDGTVLWWNPAAELLYGWSREEAVGRHISLIVPDEKIDELADIMRRLARGQRIDSFETIRVSKDGRSFPVSLSVSPIQRDDGTILGASSIGRDITQQIETEEALREAMERAEAANRAKSRFLATMSHELRTPLNAILGYTGLMSEGISGPVTDKQVHQLARIEAGTVHLMSIIENILVYSRADQGEEMVKTGDVEVCKLVRETADLLRPRAESEGLELILDLPDAPLHVRTDPAKVRQILLNLVGNAVKFTDEGEVEIAVREEEDQSAISIEIRDTGPGIAPEDQEAYFQPFRQGDQSTTRTHGGSGLGLTVSRKLARLLGGIIELESEVGRGSVFTLRIPVIGFDGTRD